jgi:hypothetical protein
MAVNSPTAKQPPSPELKSALKSLGIKDGDPKSETAGQGGLTEIRRGFNITHPMGKFAQNGVSDEGISFIKANQPESPIFFPGFMITYSDSFAQNINKEKVFGRMDPLQVFESTERRISFSWQIVSVSDEEAALNMAKINNLVKIMYPDYRRNDQTGGYNVTTSALVGLSFHGLAHGNLAASGKKGASQDSAFVGGSSQYLFGYLESLNIDHQFEDGVFLDLIVSGEKSSQSNVTKDNETVDKQGTVGTPSRPVAAKVINISAVFSPIHPETLGFDEKGNWISADKFPYYGADMNAAELFGNVKPEQEGKPYANVDFNVSPENRAAYEAYQAELRRQEASILSPQNPWERVGNKIANAYNQTVDFFDSLITTDGEDPNTGL